MSQKYIWINSLRSYALQINSKALPRSAEVEAIDMMLDYLYEEDYEIIIDMLQQIYFFMADKKLKKGDLKNRIVWYSNTYHISEDCLYKWICKAKKKFFEYLDMLKIEGTYGHKL